MSIEVNGELVGGYHWRNCETWSDTIVIAPDVLLPGLNRLVFRYDYVAAPEDAPGDDRRELSIGFSELHVGSVPRLEN